MRGYPCVCECHNEYTIHLTVTCTCGKPTKPPKPTCPRPPIPDQPGVVNLPQETPPPPPRTSPSPVWHNPNRPATGTPAEINWFRRQIGNIRRSGPTFGPRKDEYLPYLVIRASSNDRGNRPLSGVFWESPDIFVTPNVDASVAPLSPPTFGGVAVANAPNTLHAHVWNLGNSPAYRVRVEFYWFNPSLGISRADANLIGAAYIDLGNRYTHYPEWRKVDSSSPYITRGAHAIVRCPVTWFPTYENNGHECLVVRAFEPIKDGLNVDVFSPAANRHVGQRNIAVALSQSPAVVNLPLNLGYPTAPGKVTVDVEIVSPSSMEFLKLYVGPGGTPIATATEPLAAGLFPPSLRDVPILALDRIAFDCRPPLLRSSETFDLGCEPAKVGFHASVETLKPGEGYVVRIRQRIDDQIVGGYSVVLLGH